MGTIGKWWFNGISWDLMGFIWIYPLVNKQLDPENHQFLMETSLPTPMTVRIQLDSVQWEFQDPKMEVPTICKAYFLGLCKGIYPQNMA